MSLIERLKNNKIIKQIFNFGIVGVLAFIVEMLMLNVFKLWVLPWMFNGKSDDFYILIATPIAFIISAIFNYFLSILFVFKKRKDANDVQVFIIFLVLNIVALGFNELWMWIFSTKIGLHYNIAKVISTILVTIYNFISRKIFVEDHSDRKESQKKALTNDKNQNN